MDLRTGLDPKHIASITPETMGPEYCAAMKQNARAGYFLTVKRRIAGRAHDLLDAYRLEYWKRKLKKKHQ